VARKPISTPSAPPITTKWLTIEETAEFTRFSYAHIKAVIRSGELKAYYPRGGRTVRIKLSDIDAFMTGERAT